MSVLWCRLCCSFVYSIFIIILQIVISRIFVDGSFLSRYHSHGFRIYIFLLVVMMMRRVCLCVHDKNFLIPLDFDIRIHTIYKFSALCWPFRLYSLAVCTLLHYFCVVVFFSFVWASFSRSKRFLENKMRQTWNKYAIHIT